MDYRTFIRTVSERAGVPPGKAEAVTRATLETLAERITPGEAGDLASELPEALRESLVSPAPEAERFGFGEFVDRVRRRADVSPQEAREGVRAELSTLREAVGGGLRDVMSQLPQDFDKPG